MGSKGEGNENETAVASETGDERRMMPKKDLKLSKKDRRIVGMLQKKRRNVKCLGCMGEMKEEC